MLHTILPHSTHKGNFVGLRDDVGIVPYKLDGVRSIQFNILFL